MKRLQVHLAGLEGECDIECWDDTRIKAGAKWRAEIEQAVDGANVAILLISADFLASKFIKENELPPLLKSAEDDGALILPVIVSSCLFDHKPQLCQFQAVNDPATPLLGMSAGERESVFLQVAESIVTRAVALRDSRKRLARQNARKENFLDDEIWTRLVKTGSWIFDAENKTIIGEGVNSYLLSRDEYGEKPFSIEATLRFSNFHYPGESKHGMNSGIVFGFSQEKKGPRYFNVLFSGHTLMVERNEFDAPDKSKRFVHLTSEVPLLIEKDKQLEFSLEVGLETIEVRANQNKIVTLSRKPGAVGRVGLRPWRSQMHCTRFIVAERPG